MKFVANHLVNIHNVAAAEAMTLGMKAGLDPHLIYDVIADSAGSSRMFQVRGRMMADGSLVLDLVELVPPIESRVYSTSRAGLDGPKAVSQHE